MRTVRSFCAGLVRRSKMKVYTLRAPEQDIEKTKRLAPEEKKKMLQEIRKVIKKYAKKIHSTAR